MTSVETLLLLLAAVVLLAGVARVVHAPQAAVLLLGGLGMGFIPGAPSPRLEPDVVFFVFLPPLLYSAAFLATGPDLRAHAPSLGTLAIGLVLATAGGVAAVAHYVAGLPWTVAFVLGAVLGPTDPVSATSVIRRTGAPRRIETVLEGEALINDGTGLTAYTVAVGVVVSGDFSLGASLLRFVLVAAGGAAIGAVVGWVGSWVRRRADDPDIEVALALLTAYAAYIAADAAGASGVLGAVAAGLVVQRNAEADSSPATRMRSQAFWDVLTFLLNAMLFLLVGLQLSGVLDGIENRDTGTLIGAAAAVAGAVIVLRLAWMLAMSPFVLRAVGGDRLDRRRLRREQLVMGWSGMRGALSLAAALAIPLHAGGGPFPDRSLVVFLTYMTILVTLVLPALTLSPLLSRLGLGGGAARGREAAEARRRLAHAALERVEGLASEGELPEALANRLRAIHETRLQRLERDGDDEQRQARRDDGATERRARLAVLQAQREQLRELRAAGLSAGVARELQRDLDLEQSRVQRVLAG